MLYTASMVKHVNSSALENLSKLTSNKEQERVSSAVELIKYLHQIQDSPDASGSGEFSYVLKRLIRGVGSSNVSSRTGFYSTLVAILSTFPSISLGEILTFVESELHYTSDISIGEKHDIQMGRILVYGALIKSGVLLDYTTNEQQDVLKNFITLGKKRIALYVVVSTFLANFLEKVDKKYFKSIIWPVLGAELLIPWENQSPDSLFLLLRVQSLYPEVLKVEKLTKFLGTPNIIEEQSLCHLEKILLHHNLLLSDHPLIEEFCRHIAVSDLLSIFWKNSLDTHFTKGMSKNLGLLLLKILSFILENLTDKSKIPDLLTENFIVYIMANDMAKSENLMRAEAKKLFLAIVNQLSDNVDDDVRFLVIEKLLFNPGDLRFDLYAGTNIVGQLTNLLSEDGAKRLAEIYLGIITKREKCVSNLKKKWWSCKDCLYVAHQFAKVIVHPSLMKQFEWKIKQLKFFFDLAMLKNAKGIDKEGLADNIKQSFFKILDYHTSNIEYLHKLLFEIVQHIDNVLENNGQSRFRVPFTDESMTTWKKMFKVITEAQQKEKSTIITVFSVVFMYLGLQMFCNDKMAIDALEDVHSCYERAIKGLGKKTRKSSKEGEPVWVEVTVDVLLSLLSHDSHLSRSAVNCVFPHICPHLTPNALHQILEVLDPNSGVNPLSKENTEDGSHSEESDDDDEEGEEEEEANNSQSSEDFESDSADEDLKVNDKLRMAVRDALGTAALTDTESVDLDDIDEEEGNRMNKALSEAFKLLKPVQSSKGKKKKQTDDDKTLTHFRVRVLDLLDVYLSHKPSMALCLDILIPLFSLLEFCIKDSHQLPLKNRTVKSLGKLSSVKEFSSIDGVTEERLADVLSSLIEKGERTASLYLNMRDSISACGLFLVRCSVELQNQDNVPGNGVFASKTVTSVLESTLSSFVTKSDGGLLHINFFRSILSSSWRGNWSLIPFLAKCCFDSNIRTYSQNQCVELLTVFYQNHKLLKTADDDQQSLLFRMEDSLSKNTIQLLSTDALKELSQKLVSTLAKLLQAVKQFYNQQQDLKSIVDWQAIGEKLINYYENVCLSTDARINIKKLVVQMLQMRLGKSLPKAKNDTKNNINGTEEPSVNETSDKSETVNTSNEKKNKKRKRNKKHSKESVKLKQESQQLRLNALSEGFQPSVFNSLTQIDNMEPDCDFQEMPLNDTPKSNASSKEISGELDEDQFGKRKKKFNGDRLRKKKKQKTPGVSN